MIEVVATIIQREGAYFATQRGYGEFEGINQDEGIIAFNLLKVIATIYKMRKATSEV